MDAGTGIAAINCTRVLVVALLVRVATCIAVLAAALLARGLEARVVDIAVRGHLAAQGPVHALGPITGAKVLGAVVIVIAIARIVATAWDQRGLACPPRDRTLVLGARVIVRAILVKHATPAAPRILALTVLALVIAARVAVVAVA